MMSIHIYSWIKYSNWNWIWILDFLMFFLLFATLLFMVMMMIIIIFLHMEFLNIFLCLLLLCFIGHFLCPWEMFMKSFFFCFSPKICFNLIILEMEETNFSIFGQHFFDGNKTFFPDPFNDFYRKRGWTTDELLNLFVCVCVVFEIHNENVMNKCNGNE